MRNQQYSLRRSQTTFKDKPLKLNVVSKFFTMLFYSLHDAAEKGDAKLVAKLIASGANVNKKDHFENTPLIYAMIYRHHDCLAILLEAGANPNVRSDSGLNGETPLHTAVLYNDKCAAQLLINYGADLNSIENNNLQTTYQSARMRCRKEILQMMEDKQKLFTKKLEVTASNGGSLTHRLR